MFRSKVTVKPTPVLLTLNWVFLLFILPIYQIASKYRQMSRSVDLNTRLYVVQPHG